MSTPEKSVPYVARAEEQVVHYMSKKKHFQLSTGNKK